jgi:hypothetical protein
MPIPPLCNVTRLKQAGAGVLRSAVAQGIKRHCQHNDPALEYQLIEGRYVENVEAI